jgi:DNA/RNA endonuclease G (NUC1)
VGKGFNRSYWARFEKFVRDLGAEWDDVWVVTGPLFLPTRNRLGCVSAPPPFVRARPTLACD